MTERRHYYYLAWNPTVRTVKGTASHRMIGVFERGKLTSLLGISESPEKYAPFSKALDEGRFFIIGKFSIIGKSSKIFEEYRKWIKGEREYFPATMGNSYEDRGIVPEDKK